MNKKIFEIILILDHIITVSAAVAAARPSICPFIVLNGCG